MLRNKFPILVVLLALLVIPSDAFAGKHKPQVDASVQYQEAMATYRYLVEMNVKYMLMFFGVAAFCFRIALNDKKEVVSRLPLAFAVLFGVYALYSLSLVMGRMENLSEMISASPYGKGHYFEYLKDFLCASRFVLALPTIVLALAAINPERVGLRNAKCQSEA